MRILVLNSGSSSIKYRAYHDDELLIKGLVDRIGEPGSPVSDHAAGFSDLMARLDDAGLSGYLDAIGHRVVHGGEEFVEPSVVDAAVIERIRAQIPLAPLHNPANLTGIEVAYRLRPDLPQVAVFDTAFHRTMPPRAYRYAVPESLYADHGVRRYGFHGTSHAFVAEETAAHMGRSLIDTNLITLHPAMGPAWRPSREAGASTPRWGCRRWRASSWEPAPVTSTRPSSSTCCATVGWRRPRWRRSSTRRAG